MEDKQIGFKGVWIPVEILLDKRMGALDKIILATIDAMDNGEGCFASNECLCELCQCSKNKVSSTISLLVELNYIKIINFDGRRRFLKSSLPKFGRCPKICEVDSQNLGHSNITNNVAANKERKKEETFDSIFESRKVDGELKEAFVELIKARKLNGKKMTNRALELAIEKVRRMADDEKTQIAIINQSIENGWQGLFPLKREEATQSGKRRYIEAAGEDISWRRTFNLWQKALGYKVPETVGNVEAAKKLLAEEGEDGLNKLIGALAMRSKHGFLTREVKGVKDFETLLENKGAVRNFYNENCAKWERWAENAKSGKKRWEL